MRLFNSFELTITQTKAVKCTHYFLDRKNNVVQNVCRKGYDKDSLALRADFKKISENFWY